MLMEAAKVKSTIYKEDADGPGGNKDYYLGLGSAGYSDLAGT